MSIQKHYAVPFKSLQTSTLYTVNIYKEGTPQGGVQTLDGAADPFETQEDNDEDVFIDVRTQTGTLRIVHSDGSSLWSEMAPANDVDTPVTLTHEVDGNTILDWQGFLQSEDFGHTLYGDPQELEIPVQCPLSVLQSRHVSTEEYASRNFAYILKTLIDEINGISDGIVTLDTVVVGGGADAQAWLLIETDWQNFLTTDSEGNIEPKYNYFEVLEDLCRFWGWTARTMQQTLYLTNADDAAEQSLLTLTYSQLATMAGGTAAGTIVQPDTVVISGDCFADTNNTESLLRGFSKATVKVDCNQQDTVMKFAPLAVQKILDGQWTWVQGSEDLTGYFTTPTQKSCTTDVLDCTSSSDAYNGFCRRQIFADKDAENATKSDMVLMNNTYDGATPLAQIVIKRTRSYGGGSLSIDGTLYQGVKAMEAKDPGTWFLIIRLGIGSSRDSARWYKLTCDAQGNIFSSWENTPQHLALNVNGNKISGFAAWRAPELFTRAITWGNFKFIPVEDGLRGQMFIDFLGMCSVDGGKTIGDLADFTVTFTRDKTYIQSNTEARRARTMEDERESEKEYTATNSGKTDDEWNADCIFASDNNLDYGFGLLLDPEDGTFVETVPYGIAQEHPEQHLANRVASFLERSRRMLDINVISTYAANVTPSTYITIGNPQHYHPLAISHQWWDDVTNISMIEL